MQREGFLMEDSVDKEMLHQLRFADKQRLGRALNDARLRTLRLLDHYESALGREMTVPLAPILNPPRWEFGHVGWFADWWLSRNPDRDRGLDADPNAHRWPARQARRGVDADALYDSSAVAHDRRWTLNLPSTAQTRSDLINSLADTLTCLKTASNDDQGLYFFRLALFHEDMHAEAAVYMAQTLGFDPGYDLDHGQQPLTSTAELTVAPCEVRLGYQEPGFCFDNELGAEVVWTSEFKIDARALTWEQYRPFIESGGYSDPRWWCELGWHWRCSGKQSLPRYLRRDVDSAWEVLRFGRWQPLDLSTTAVHLSAFEAQAWCRWAKRRLPTEAEWVAAAQSTAGFEWGQVWEWTASAFKPFEGFMAHPYRDYSQPWFDGRPVLKGACTATRARMRHLQYRNFSLPDRNDIFSGFRSVAL